MENKNIMQNKGNNKKNHDTTKNDKKPFNKRKYREKKYSNKFRVNQWEEQRRKKVIRGFLKELKSDEKAAKFSSKNDNQTSETIENIKRNKGSLLSIKRQLLKKKQEKKEEILRIKREREEALRKYKEKKMQTYKELSKKTKKGQPVMRGRMELLLQKIQNNI